MIEIKINADTPEQARAIMAGLLGGAASDAVATAQPAATPAKATPAKAKDKVAEAPKPDPTPAAGATPAETPAATADQPSETDSSGSATTAELDYDKDVTPAVLAVAQNKGRDGVLGLLKKFNAANAKDVPKERWAELIADANALLAGV